MDIDAVLFGDDEDAPKKVAVGSMRRGAPGRGSEASAATQESSHPTVGMSRRKQAQLEATERKQRDKYAEEKETDVGQLQSLEDAEQEGISNKVWIWLGLQHVGTRLRLLYTGFSRWMLRPAPPLVVNGGF